MQKKHVLWMGRALLCAYVLTSGSVVALGAETTYDLKEVVVTATKIEENPEKVPASVNVITASDIEKHNYTSVAQAMGQLPGVFLSPVADGGIMVRGFGSSDILVLVDGQPLNSGWNGSVDWSLIPIENIQKIEVVRGAGASLYGGRATGGVIQILTKEHEDGVHGTATLSYGSHNSRQHGINVSVKKDKLDIGVGYEKRKTDGWQGFYIEELPTAKLKGAIPILAPNSLETSARERYIVGGRGKKAIDTESWSIKGKYQFNDDQSLTYSYTHSDYHSSYNNPFSYVKDENGKEIFFGAVPIQVNSWLKLSPDRFLGYVNEKEWSVHSLSYDDDKNLFHVHLGITDVTKDGYSSPSTIGKALTAEELQQWNGKGQQSFYPSKTKDFDMHKTWEMGKHTILAGVAYRSQSFAQTRYVLENWRNHNGSKFAYELHGGKDISLSGYIQDKWQVTDRLAVYGGMRLDRYKKMDGYSDYLLKGVQRNYEEGTYTELSPKIALEYSPDKDITFYASYGHSFTPPILYQVYRDGGMVVENIGGNLQVKEKEVLSNPQLKPEISDTFEIGARKKWGQKDSASLSYYRVRTEDAIRYFKTAKPTKFNGILYLKGFGQYRNLGTADKQGIELEGTHKFNKVWSTYFNYAWETERIDGENNYDIPRHIVHFGIRYNLNKWDILADAQYISARQAPEVETGRYQSEDAFFITNLSANYAVTPEATLQLGIYNLFNREFYASEAAGGRAYNITLRYKF